MAGTSKTQGLVLKTPSTVFSPDHPLHMKHGVGGVCKQTQAMGKNNQRKIKERRNSPTNKEYYLAGKSFMEAG